MKKNNRNLAIGAVIAASIGYVAGILTAPKKGSETRRDLINVSLKTKTEAEKTFKKIYPQLVAVIKQGEFKLKKTKASTKSGLALAVNRTKKAKAQVREILSAIHEGDAENHDLKKAITEVNKSIEHLKKYLGKNVNKTKI